MEGLANELHAARQQALSGQYATAGVYMDNIISSIRGSSGKATIVRELREERKLLKQLSEIVEGFRAQPGRKQVSDSIWSKGDGGYAANGNRGGHKYSKEPRELEKKDPIVWDPPTPPRKKDKHLPSWAARKDEGARSGGRASGGRDHSSHGGGSRPHFSRRAAAGGGAGGVGAGGARRRQRPTAGVRSRDNRKRGSGGKSRPGDDNKANVKKGKRKLFVESDTASQLDAREIEMAEMIGKSRSWGRERQ